MNKAQLVEALTTRIGDRRTAAAAVDGLVDVIVETVGSGRSVTLTGFGVFEPRRRAARVARNPRTGETVPVPETVVPSFRPGAAFRDEIGRSQQAAAGATSAPRRAPRDGETEEPAPTQRTRSRSTRSAAAKSTTGAKTASAAKAAAAKPAAAAKTTRSSAAKGTTSATAKSRKSSGTGAAARTAKAAPKDTTSATPAKRTRSKAS